MLLQGTPFIRPEDIDKAIEEALSNPVNFSFAIDFKGNIYRDHVTPSELKNNGI